MNSRDMELAAAAVIGEIRSPVADRFLDAGGWVEWQRVADRYVMLSTGERALVDLARHLSWRRPEKDNASFLVALSRVDQRCRDTVINALLCLLEDDQQLRTVKR